MIVLVVRIKLQDGKRDDFFEIAKPMVACSKNEAGNIEYALYEELDEGNTVAYIEKWKNQEALDFHGKTDHFIEHRSKLEKLWVSPPIRNCYDLVY